MSGTADRVLETYLGGVDADAAPTVRALDAVIRAAHASFAVAIKYNILMYAINGDWRHWVVAVDAHPKAAIGLRFLYGVLLDDPRHVLRAGTSVLETWDIPRGAEVDVEAVTAYVREAVAKYPSYRADAAAIIETRRATATGAKRTRSKARG